MARDKDILRAERLRAVINMPEYSATIGTWLEQARESALHELMNAKEHHEIHRAQGAVQILESIKDNFDSVFEMESIALNKNHKKVKGE